MKKDLQPKHENLLHRKKPGSIARARTYNIGAQKKCKKSEKFFTKVLRNQILFVYLQWS